jgi:C4-dicarboxylate transporter DctM subunit
MSVLAAIVALAVIGSPLFVIVGAATGVAFIVYTPDVHQLADLAWVIDPFEELMGKDQFLAIPLFVGAGALMTEGGMARRLVAFTRALLGWLPGGLGIAAVAACMGFAAISGSSPVTLIAVGSIMYPALVQKGYSENFSLGLVMTAGSLGCLVVPSLILMIYSLAVGSTKAAVDAGDMFVAAYIPAAAVGLILCLHCIVVGARLKDREPFSLAKVFETAREGVWALALPLVVFFGIRQGFFAPFKAGAVAFIYALVVTTVVHRELTIPKVFKVLGDAGRLMGMLILIIGLTFGLNKLLALVKVEDVIAAWVEPLGPVSFMLIVNVLLIILGALMDSVSATLVFAPILAPIAMSKGIDPIHFGIVFVVNMEIGYLAPPVATNLFVAAALFKKPFGQVSRAVLPGLALTTGALIMFMFVPTCSKGLVNVQRGVAVWEPFPWDGKPHASLAGVPGGPDLQVLSDEATTDVDTNQGDLNTQTDDEYYFGSADDPTQAGSGSGTGSGSGSGSGSGTGSGSGSGAGSDDEPPPDDSLDGVQL